MDVLDTNLRSAVCRAVTLHLRSERGLGMNRSGIVRLQAFRLHSVQFSIIDELTSRRPCFNPVAFNACKSKFSRRNVAVSGTEVFSDNGSNGACIAKRTAIVWFKHDLRMDDHPGLATAAEYSQVVPLFVFDPALLAGWSLDLVKALKDAVLDLQQSLQQRNSGLIVKFGKTQDVLMTLARQLGALDIITEEEVDVELQDLVGLVSASLSVEAIAGQATAVRLWSTPIYKFKNYDSLPDSYKDFKKLRCPFTFPVVCPTSLPSLPDNIDIGYVPSLEDIINSVRKFHSHNHCNQRLRAQKIPALQLLDSQNGLAASARDNSEFSYWWEKTVIPSTNSIAINKGDQEDGPEFTRLENGDFTLQGGETGALNYLKGYLRYLESTHRDDWKKLYEQVWPLEQQPGASFRALFGNALVLGTLSLRRVHYEALEYERARGGGWLSPFGFSTFTAEAAITTARSIDWYQMLAHKSRMQGSERGLHVGTWRWRGFLIQYSMAGDSGAPVVLVHGFGAFWEHYRDNIKGLAEMGHRVWALTMLGFGRSEKPSLIYTELLWAELVRDFIVEVVGEPVFLAGNSIGGYTASAVAGLWPALVKSVVLFNSAGRVVPDYESPKYLKPKEKSRIAKLGSYLLLAYLQKLSPGMLTKCYPTNPWRADTWLLSEVLRASYDPGSMAVLLSMFYLRAPLPLNYFLDRFSGNILVIQGMRDPLHNSSKRASMLQAYCNNVSIQYVNAGHCPHDELPNEVNGILSEWLTLQQNQPLLDKKNVQYKTQGPVDKQTSRVGDIVKDEIRLAGPMRPLKEVEELV